MISKRWLLASIAVVVLIIATVPFSHADDATIDDKIGKSSDASRTDDEVVEREEEAIKLDGLSVKEYKELRAKAEKHHFQAEVSRMMKLIINSLYKNKEIFLRELISNASDALDKVRLLSLTNREALDATDDLSIRIKLDKENHILTITDTGLGMTKKDLQENLGTIAKSGTNEFMKKLTESNSDQQSDLIGQFGVGFYSAFLVADKVVVTSKHSDDVQYIWESDASSFSVVKDPRGASLKRGTQISLHLKEEAYEYLEIPTVKELIRKYSQFINFDIYLWTSKTETVEEPIDEDEAPEDKKTDEDEGAVEEEKEDKPKTKKVEKTSWDWEKMNENKPLWTRNAEDITQEEYDQFYKSFTKDSEGPVAQVHFKAEGEVTFNALLYVPKKLPSDMFNNYGKKTDHIKLYVKRVFITDDFQAMMPKYLSFIRGIVDSDDLPLNVSRETLQQHKLLKVIQKKLVRKVLDMIKKMDKESYEIFWKEFSTNMKLGVMEDTSNRTRVSKLLRFFTSTSPDTQVSLAEYVERMKDTQEHIYYMCGSGKEEVTSSPFVERLIQKGYEVVYCIEPVDEYAIQAMPEFDGKKFQNVAKDGVNIDQGEKAKERQTALEEEFKPLTEWLKETPLKEDIEKATISQRLTTSPCALVASSYGWSGNMERIMKSQAYAKPNDPTQNFYATQKKTFELNPRHPVVKELLRRVSDDKEDVLAAATAKLLFETATLRSGFVLTDQVGFAERIEAVLKKSMDIAHDAAVEEEEEINEDEPVEESKDEEEIDGEEGKDEL